MTPFAPQLGAPLRGWRVDQAVYKATWDSAIGAHRSGGRWNRKGRKALYCSLDAATAILEVAVRSVVVLFALVADGQNDNQLGPGDLVFDDVAGAAEWHDELSPE